MTVPELIEALQAIPGDSTLRTMRVLVTVGRPYAKPTAAEGPITHVGVEGTEVILYTNVQIQ